MPPREMLTLTVLLAPIVAQAGTNASTAAAKHVGVCVRESKALSSSTQKADGAVMALAVVGAITASYGICMVGDDNKAKGS